MFFLPLPIVVALMLLSMLLMLRERLLNAPSGRVFAALLLMYCFALLLIGLRWGYNITALLPLQALLAAAWPPLAWVAFRSLSREARIMQWPQDWPHLLPIGLVLLAILLWPEPIDVLLMLIFVVYGVLLLRLARRGPDALRLVRLSDARFSHLALVATGCLLLAFTLIDLLISIDIRLYQGSRSATIVALANVPSIFILGLAAVVGGQGRSEGEAQLDATDIEVDNSDEVEARALMPLLEQLLVGQELYKEPELNLQRLARKAGVPARKVSRAVNLLTEQNVSQWVNEQRVKAACELLKNSDENVTSIMLNVGFMTKSNFNREFKRITGTSPSGWRGA